MIPARNTNDLLYDLYKISIWTFCYVYDQVYDFLYMFYLLFKVLVLKHKVRHLHLDLWMEMTT